MKLRIFHIPTATVPRALDAINVSFPEENIFAITGMSGSGKTTLLNCLARFLRPQQGSIMLGRW